MKAGIVYYNICLFLVDINCKKSYNVVIQELKNIIRNE